ncbi:uncharacterized protein [Oscarella lobularis]
MDLARLLSDPNTSRVCLRAFLRNEDHEHPVDVDDDVLTVLIRTLKHANEREVQALVASTLAVVTSGADDSKRLAATKKGVVRPLIALCLDRRHDISNNAAVKEQLVVHERALATLRNLTTLPSFCHELESIDFGGVDILKLFIDWCLVWDEESSSLYASFGHLVVDDSDAAAAFDSLAVGKELVGRVLNRCQDDDDGILVDLFDMSDDDDEEARLCEILLESGHFERSFFDIDERGFNSFWANVIVDGETFDDGQFRAVVSQIKEGENGCRYSVPLRDKGEKVQCRLVGARPVVRCQLAIEHATAILRNVASCSSSFRSSIARRGLRALQKLVYLPLRRVRAQAIALLANLSADSTLLSAIGETGITTELASIGIDLTNGHEIVLLSIRCLRNLSVLKENRAPLEADDKWVKLLEAAERSDNEEIWQEALSLTKNMWKDAICSRKSLPQATDVSQRNSPSLSRSPKLTDPSSAEKKRGYGPGEWISEPISRHVPRELVVNDRGNGSHGVDDDNDDDDDDDDLSTFFTNLRFSTRQSPSQNQLSATDQRIYQRNRNHGLTNDQTRVLASTTERKMFYRFIFT